MGVEAMNEVAQGRVWTGRQALQEGLTDHMGGLWKAIEIAANMSCYHLPKNYNSNNNKGINNRLYYYDNICVITVLTL